MITRRCALNRIALCGASVCLPACAAAQPLHKARYWRFADGAVECDLCPHGCIIDNGETSLCRTRRNLGGTLYTLAYGNPCALHVDPIEKKPLYHVLPGARAYSIAIAGCVLTCKNCQNASISQIGPEQSRSVRRSPREIVDEAKRRGCTTIAYTYSEPTAWYEYMFDTAKRARRAGLRNLLITCGYINPAPLKDLAPYLDAANIDLKSFSQATYEQLNAGDLQPVLDCITNALAWGVWVEITNLIVPSWTDDLKGIRALSAWVAGTCGAGVPLHFSRFYPSFRLTNLPPTPTRTLTAARDIARGAGVRYVYIGNAARQDTNTYCHACGALLIERRGYLVKHNAVREGRCGKCGEKIPGIWT